MKRSLRRFAEGNGFEAGIWHEGHLAGVVGYHGIDRQDRATSLGYWLGEEFQGHGLVIRACQAMTDHAFGELGLNRITVSCVTGNRRSRAVPERLDFEQEGVLREAEWLYDRFVDHALYAGLASRWRKSS